MTGEVAEIKTQLIDENGRLKGMNFASFSTSVGSDSVCTGEIEYKKNHIKALSSDFKLEIDRVRRLEDENKKLKDDIELLKDDLHDEYMTNHTVYYKQMWEKAENELKKKETEAKQDHEFALMLENKLDKLNALYHSHLRRDNPFVEYKSWTEMFN